MTTGLLRSALEGEQPVLFSDLAPPALCLFCGRPRPQEVAGTWMCHSCKAMPLYKAIWLIPLPGRDPGGKERAG
jgi:hypothetical protein